MSFVQIGFLLALAAVAIPILIHLVFRQKAKRVDLGTLRFLRVVLQQNARRRSVMRWLLLAIRIACIVALSLLFARPYWLAFRPSGEKQTVVVLIDRSATMELKGEKGERLIDEAVAATQAMLSKATKNTNFEIAYFDHMVRPLVDPAGSATKPREYSPPELASKLTSPDVCSGGTDYGAAMEWARDTLTKAPPGPRRLHIFTDLQQSGLAWSETDALPSDVISHVHDLGRAATSNIAVTEARPEQTWLRPNEPTSVHVAVYNGSPFTTPMLPVLLELASEGKTVELRQEVKIEPGAVESVRFDLPSLAEGQWEGTVKVQAEDDLAVDNERHVAILASPPYQVLLVDGRSASSPVLASTYFLEAALRLAPQGQLSPITLFEPRRISADEILPSLDKYDVVVLADAGGLDASSADRISRFVREGGGLLVFSGASVTPESTKTLSAAGLGVGTVEGVAHADGLPLRLQTWDTTHPVFAVFSDPQVGDLKRLSFSACTKIKPAADAKVLARFRGDRPAVIERRHGKGSVLWFTSSCDSQWSDWARSRLYLPMMHQLLSYQTGLSDGGRIRQAILERDALPRTAKPPGIHPSDDHSLVVNLSPREAETERCTLDEFVNRFGLNLGTDQVDESLPPIQSAAVGTALMDSEVWPFFALGLFGLLVLETLVANRTAA